jgi:hypothetical protein
VKRVAVALAMVVTLGACLFGPEIDCDDSDWDNGPTCDAVVEAARGALAGTGVAKLEAVEGIHCPEAPEWCPATFVVTVFADLLDGSQVVVIVRLQEDGRLITHAPDRVIEAIDRER